MAEVRDPIQEQLIAARRAQILDAATSVFADKGFHRATIKDIARVAGIADGTIYNYFDNKTALLLGILNRLNETEHRDDDLAQLTTGDIRTAARTYIQHRLNILMPQNVGVFQVILSEILVNKELRDLYYTQIIEPTFALADKHFQGWVEQGVLKPLDAQLMLRAISGMFLGLLMLHIMGDQTILSNWDELPDLLTDMLLDGIGQGDHQ